MNEKQTIEFAVQTDEKGIVQKIGRSTVYQPKIQYDDTKPPTKWVDDSKYLKGAKKSDI